MKKIITTMLTACLCAAFLGACNQEQSSKGYLDVNDDNSENIVWECKYCLLPYLYSCTVYIFVLSLQLGRRSPA